MGNGLVNIGIDVDFGYEGRLIDTGLEIGGELEKRHQAVGKQHLFAGTRIACGARFAAFDAKCAKTADFNGAAIAEAFAYERKEFFEDIADIGTDKTRRLGDVLDQVVFGNIGHIGNIGLCP